MEDLALSGLDLHGVEVDRDFLLSLGGAVERRAMIHALVEESWSDLSELLRTLEEIFSHDPSWLCDVYELLVDPKLWPWISGWDASVLSSLSGVVPSTAFHKPEVVSLLWRIRGQLDCRPEALFSGEALRFAHWFEERVKETLH